jgi:hypothetical protein
MSTLRVNKIVNLNDDGPVEFTKGVEVPSGQTINGDVQINTTGIVTSTSLIVSGDMNLSGVVTATSFSGSGSLLTGVPGTPNGKAIAFTLIG